MKNFVLGVVVGCVLLCFVLSTLYFVSQGNDNVIAINVVSFMIPIVTTIFGLVAYKVEMTPYKWFAGCAIIGGLIGTLTIFSNYQAEGGSALSMNGEAVNLECSCRSKRINAIFYYMTFLCVFTLFFLLPGRWLVTNLNKELSPWLPLENRYGESASANVFYVMIIILICVVAAFSAPLGYSDGEPNCDCVNTHDFNWLIVSSVFGGAIVFGLLGMMLKIGVDINKYTVVPPTLAPSKMTTPSNIQYTDLPPEPKPLPSIPQQYPPELTPSEVIDILRSRPLPPLPNPSTSTPIPVSLVEDIDQNVDYGRIVLREPTNIYTSGSKYDYVPSQESAVSDPYYTSIPTSVFQSTPNVIQHEYAPMSDI